MKAARHETARRPAPTGAGFPGQIEREARRLRRRNTPLTSFLAAELEKIAGKARFLRAEGAREYYEREEVEEDNVRTNWYDLGRRHAREDAQERRTFGALGRPLPPGEPASAGLSIPEDCPW